MSLSIAGNSIEEFFDNIFNSKFQLKEIYDVLQRPKKF